MILESYFRLYLVVGFIVGIAYSLDQYRSGGSTFYDPLMPILGPQLAFALGTMIAALVCSIIWPLTVVDYAWKWLKGRGHD